MSKAFTKIGMYGEMPVIKIGKYSICEMTNAKNEKSVWIQIAGGEGGQFPKSRLLPLIDKFFKDNF